VLLAARELGRAVVVDQLAEELDRRRRAASFGLHRFTRARPLLLHALAEPVVVDTAPVLLGDLAREVDREAQGVVEEERLLTGHVAFLQDAFEHVETALERLAESLLLVRDDL